MYQELTEFGTLLFSLFDFPQLDCIARSTTFAFKQIIN